MARWGWRKGFRSGWPAFLPVVAGIVVLWSGGAWGISGERGSALQLSAETPGRIRFTVDGGATASVRGRWRVEKVRGGSPWLFTGYLPNGLVAEGPFATPDGRVDLELTLWDPGLYRLTYQTAGAGGKAPAVGSLEVGVRPEAVKTRNTLLLLGGLAILGLACGLAAGSLRRPDGAARGGGRPESAVTVLALAAAIAMVLPGNAGLAAGRDAGGKWTVHGGAAHEVRTTPAPRAGPAAAVPEGGRGSIVWSPATPTVKEPVRIRVLGDTARGVSLALTRDEDGLVFLRQRLPEWSGPAEWTFVFPDGTGYTVEAVAGARERASLAVSALPPERGQQLRSLVLLLAVYAVAASLGFAWARRRRPRPTPAGAEAGLGRS